METEPEQPVVNTEQPESTTPKASKKRKVAATKSRKKSTKKQQQDDDAKKLEVSTDASQPEQSEEPIKSVRKSARVKSKSKLAVEENKQSEPDIEPEVVEDDPAVPPVNTHSRLTMLSRSFTLRRCCLA